MAIGEAGIARVATGFSQGGGYVALFVGNTEVSGGGYARQQVTLQRSTEQGNTNNIVNNAELDFGTATANWGTVSQVRIYTTATTTSASNLVYTANITARTINSGDSVSIPANGYPIQIT